jgi:pectin methylesterase-like acyl-CoA thioesterase
MGVCLPTRRLLVGLTLVVLLAGCSSGATTAPSPTGPAPASTTAPSATVVTPSATPTPTPTLTPAPTPLASVTVTVIGSTAQVPAPNGSDDTATIQSALDACVKHGPGCTVQLQAGTYKTRQLVAKNFQGTFKGAGMATTIIEALPALPVNVPDFLSAGECVPNLTDCLWPSPWGTRTRSGSPAEAVGG